MAASGAKVLQLRVGRVRAQPRRQAARALDVRASGRNLDSRGGRADAREGDDLRGHAHARGDALPRRGHGALRSCSPRSPRPASTSTRSSRHPRPEIVFSAPTSDRDAGDRRARRARRRSGARGTTSARSALIGAGMKSHPGVAARHVRRRSPRSRSSRRSSRPRRSRSRATFRATTSSERWRRSTTPSSSTRPTRSASMASGGPARIGVVGATGAVGKVTLELLAAAGTRTCARSRQRARQGARGFRHGNARGRGGDARGARRRQPRPVSSSPSARRRAASSSRTRCAAARWPSTSRPPSGSRTASRSSCRR